LFSEIEPRARAERAVICWSVKYGYEGWRMVGWGSMGGFDEGDGGVCGVGIILPEG
jgi:hypothetical protein